MSGGILMSLSITHAPRRDPVRTSPGLEDSATPSAGAEGDGAEGDGAEGDGAEGDGAEGEGCSGRGLEWKAGKVRWA
jgi:hypothetical protein